MILVGFLIDESAPKRLALWIRKQGHSAYTLHDFNASGVKNGEVIKLALNLNAIIITCDEDFIIQKKDLQSKLKIILFKLRVRKFENIKNLWDKFYESFIINLKEPGLLIITDFDCKYIKF